MGKKRRKRGEQPNQRQKRSWFSMAVCFLFAFLLPLEIGGLRELWSFLEEYQLSLPENVAQEGLELFQNQDMETLSQFVEYTPHPLDRVSSLDNWLESYLGFDSGEAEYTLIPQTGTSNQKRYVVARDGFKIAELLLTPSGEETKRGFPLWELSDIEIASASGHYGMEITLPQGVDLTVNGFLVDDTYLIENAVPIEVSGFADMGAEFQPIALKYRIEGLLEPPEIQVFPRDTGECVIEEMGSENEGAVVHYRAVRYGGPDFSGTVGIKAENAAKLYARFITKDAELDALMPYLFQGGPLYQHLYGFSNSWYIDHDSYEFQDFQMDRFILYDESHFSCDVTFNYIIRMGAKVYEYPSAYTLYFLYGEGNWQLASLEIR